MKKSTWLCALLALALVAGCSNMKEPATQAVAGVDSALAAVRDDAAKYAPEALAPVDAQVTALKASLAKQDYKAVMAAAPNATSAVSSLKETVAAKKTEMEAAAAKATEEWQSLSTDVPKMVAAIQSRVDILSKSRKLPKNLDKAAFESAKSGLETMKASWAEASSAFSSGNAVDAVVKAQAVKEKGMEIMTALGMKAG